MRRRLLEVLGLSSFAVAQPLFDLLGAETGFFVARGSRPVDIVLFAVLAVAAPAVAAGAVSYGAHRLGARTGAIVHASVLGLLAALVAQPVIARSTVGRLSDGWLPTLVALACGAMFVALHRRLELVRGMTVASAVGALVFPGLFLLGSDVRSLLRPDPPPGSWSVETDSTGDTSVLVMVFDALPMASLMEADGSLDADLYPNFAALAAEGVWFRNATTPATDTLLALPALLSGKAPRDGEPDPVLREHPENLLSFFGATRSVVGFEAVTRLCPVEFCGERDAPFGVRLASLIDDLGVVYLHLVSPEPLVARLPEVRYTWFGFAADWQRDQRRNLDHWVESFLDDVESSPPGGFWFQHLVAPHQPFVHYPSGMRYLEDLSALPRHNAVPGFRAGRWFGSKPQLDRARQRHLMQLRYCDLLVGRVLERLRRMGRYDSTWIVLTADHGVAFTHGLSARRPMPGNETEILRVPLIVKPAAGAPDWVSGTVVDREVSTLDLAPTIAAALGADLPWRTDGRRLRPSPAAAELSPEVLAPVRSRHEDLADGWRAVGPHPESIGRRVEAVMPAGPERVVVHGPDRFDDVDPAAGWVPGWIVGEYESEVESADPVPLAVALDGVVLDTTWAEPPMRGLDHWEWQVILPEESFRAGAHRLEVFRLVDSGSGVRLRRIPLR